MTYNNELGILMLIFWMVFVIYMVINTYTTALEAGVELSIREKSVLTGIMVISTILFIISLIASTSRGMD